MLARIFKIIRQNIIGFILGLLVMGTGVYAASVIAASNVGYSDNYNLGAANVQDAIDKLSAKLDNQYFDFTTAKTNITGKVFASKKGVCISRNKTVYCFKINNWNIEKDHIKQVFSDVSCNVTSNSIACNASDFCCSVASYGDVRCYDSSDYSNCLVSSSGKVNCS